MITVTSHANRKRERPCPLTPETLAATSISDLISLKGRKAVVTGGARGMGEAIAERLAEAGADVLIGDREADLAAATAANLAKTYGVEAKGVFLDVAQSKSVSNLAETADKDWGRIDVWVNCAGIQPGKLLVETTDEEWHAMNDVNLGGVFFGCREAAKRMVAVNNGVIINITSVCAYRGRAVAGALLRDQARRRRHDAVDGDGTRALSACAWCACRPARPIRPACARRWPMPRRAVALRTRASRP